MEPSPKTAWIGIQSIFQISRACHPQTTPYWTVVVGSVALAFLLVVGGGCKRNVSSKPLGATVQIKVPLGLPPVPIPADNPPTEETISLGRKLFYDTKLSKDDTLSCASCHNARMGFTDGLQFSHGVGGQIGVRNAPTIANAAYLPFQFWDGRAITLEEQAAGPIANPIEMDQPHNASVAKLKNDPAYKPLFLKAFGPGGVTLIRVENALASFERTILSGNSAFDRYEFSGDKNALTPEQVRGFSIFVDPTRGNCAACHTVNEKYALFTDGKFHNIGEGVGDEGQFADIGRFHMTKIATDTGAFMTPTLRNVANTGPYMHNGSLKTLKEVVDFYAGGGNSNPYLDKEIRAIKLSSQDRSDLVAFLQSLTGEMPANVGPPEK